MGQFSWLDCKTEEQIIDDRVRDVYVLVPKQFGGGHIKEECYDGYGHFGNHDIYDLVAEWNKDSIIKIYNKRKADCWKPFDEELLDKVVLMFGNGISEDAIKCEIMTTANNKWIAEDWKRMLGIMIACHDEDNAELPYPIKITHSKDAIYEYCDVSLSDPNQG